MHPKRTSYRKIAIEAGVSYKTLYRVLNHAPNVSDSTREKIIRIMKRHGCMDARLPAGCSVVIYVDANKYMLEHAKNCLLYTNKSMSEIAEMLHCSSIYFNRFFRSRTGCTPLQYRKNNTYS